MRGGGGKGGGLCSPLDPPLNESRWTTLKRGGVGGTVQGGGNRMIQNGNNFSYLGLIFFT